MFNPSSVTQDHLRTISKAHAVPVLEALSKAPDGLPHKDLDYGVVKTSGTHTLLKELLAVGYIKKRPDGKYEVTGMGKKALGLAKQIVALPASEAGT